MTHLDHTPTPAPADQWLAYRYLTGELTDAEAADCEARLADDPSLQMALAECVLLTGGLAGVARPPAVRATVRRSSQQPDLWKHSHSSWVAAAVCLLAAGLLWSTVSLTSRQTAGDNAGAAQVAVLDPSSVVAMWSELHVDSASHDQGETGTRLESSGFDDEQLDIPDWMLAAVLAEPVEGEDAVPAQEQQL
jgi:ferric-dicitrate binding protein FerR (iron transport regulator)